MPKRKRNLDRSVTRKVILIVGGRQLKTGKTKISLNQAVRDIGKDPVGTEGRLLTGVPLRIKRSIVKGVSVQVVYSCNPKPDTGVLVGWNVSEAVEVAKIGVTV